MRGLLLTYRIMATVIGICLILLICVGVPLEYLAAEGGTPQQVGAFIDTWVGFAHGVLLYPAFLIVAAVLSRWARWSISFTIFILVVGTIPFLSFVGEHYATKRVLADFPELAEPRGGAEHVDDQTDDQVTSR